MTIPQPPLSDPHVGGPELLPCPWCCGRGVIDSLPVGDDIQFFVRCVSCAAEGPWGHSAGMARGSWNRRPSPPVVADRDAVRAQALVEEGRRDALGLVASRLRAEASYVWNVGSMALLVRLADEFEPASLPKGEKP